MKPYKYWEKILIKELYRLWNHSQKFLRCHGPEHHIRVWKTAEPFGRKKAADMGVLLASCLLHDVSAFNRMTPKGHETVSAHMAQKVLKRIGFPKEKIPAVLSAISEHRSDSKVKNSLEGRIFKAFDKIDAFGPIGVYRILLPLSIRGYSLEDIIGWAFDRQRLVKKWKSVTFPELRKKYRPRYDYTVDYFKQLKAELGLKKVKTVYSEKKVFAR
ncbi:MAG: HD domain-containing protein [Patescibacteria group bacterium]|jgi:hypothetical protein